jgi:hypothetical protein
LNGDVLPKQLRCGGQPERIVTRTCVAVIASPQLVFLHRVRNRQVRKNFLKSLHACDYEQSLADFAWARRISQHLYT